MTDRERLIELILNCERVDLPLPMEYQEHLADHLLANGVIVPPVMVGQKLYDIQEFVLGVVCPEIYELKADEMTIESGQDGAVRFVYDGFYVKNEDVGKTLFFTEWHAKEALKGALKERERDDG